MKISSILSNKGSFVATVSPDASVSQLLALLAEHKIGAVVVADADGSVGGIVSERDVARAAHTHGAGALEQPVSAIMTELVVTCAPGASTEELMSLMTERRVRHIPVIEDDEMVGIVSIGDVVKARLAELETERDALQAYISS
ncbi:MAG: CBS domain-containing protein [Candidatus Nanopelagicales bacterium]|jgi:CBS domain-containing protein